MTAVRILRTSSGRLPNDHMSCDPKPRSADLPRKPGLQEVGRTSAALPAPTAPLALAARQTSAPAIVFGAGELGVDEAVDALVGDHLASMLEGEPAGNLL